MKYIYRIVIQNKHIVSIDLVDDLEETVATSFHNRSGINVTSALAEARNILREIKGRDFTDEKNRAREEHE